MRKHLLPPSDEDLAAAELTEQARQQRALDDQAEEDRAERLAQAGEPEARAALMASASLLTSQPAQPRKLTSRRPSPVAVKAVPQPEPETKRQLPDDQEKAFQLMDLAFQRFYRDFKKSPKEARTNLALDLGRDTAVYLKNGIWKVADALDAINKLTGAGGRTKQDDDGDDENLDDSIDKLRAVLRG